jgi:hypothetical protein
MASKAQVSRTDSVCTEISANGWASRPTPAIHPEDQILQIVRDNKAIPLAMLPKHLRRTSLWTLELERRGLIKRVACKVRGASALLLVSTETLLVRTD